MNRLIHRSSASLLVHIGKQAPKQLPQHTFRAPLHAATMHSGVNSTPPLRVGLCGPNALLCNVPVSNPFSLNSIRLGSTLKKRSDKMNKHKLKKRRKSLRFNTKASRGKVR